MAISIAMAPSMSISSVLGPLEDIFWALEASKISYKFVKTDLHRGWAAPGIRHFSRYQADHQHENVRYQHQSIRHQAKKVRYQQQSIRHQHQMGRYQHHSIRHQHQMGRYQQQSIRDQRQMGRHQHHSIRHQHQMGRYQKQSIRDQRRMGRYQNYLTWPSSRPGAGISTKFLGRHYLGF